MKKEYFIYRYFNKNNEIIYVGLTERPLKNRVREHSTEALFQETEYIDYAVCDCAADMEIYEIYYINKYLPKYNIKSAKPEKTSIKLPELDFQIFWQKEGSVINTGEKKEFSVALNNGGRLFFIILDPYCKNPEDIKVNIKIQGKSIVNAQELAEILKIGTEVLGHLN